MEVAKNSIPESHPSMFVSGFAMALSFVTVIELGTFFIAKILIPQI